LTQRPIYRRPRTRCGPSVLLGSLELANGESSESGFVVDVDCFPGRGFYVEHAGVPWPLGDEGQGPIDCSRVSLEHCFDASVGEVFYPPGKPQFFGASPRGLAKPDPLDAAENKDVNALASHASVDPEAIAARSDEFRARVLVENRSTFLSIGVAG